MTLIEQVINLISSGEIQEISTNFIEDILNAILDDFVSGGKIMMTIAKTPFFVYYSITRTLKEDLQFLGSILQNVIWHTVHVHKDY